MNGMRVLIAGLVFALGAGSIFQASAESVDPSVKFAANADGGGNTCGIPAKYQAPVEPGDLYGEEYVVSFDKDEHNCDNDQYNYFRLENVPSATKIVLRSDYCHDDDNKEWTFWLSTYINPTTTGWISIGSLASASVGELVTKGVKLEKKEVNGPGDYIRELSCVKITRSAKP